MPPNQLSVSWGTFNNNVCQGLATLQQKEEFVDLTLAADGHFVKVHKLVIVLASPYLKDLISSMPSSHPVIFLNDVSSQILSLILEYIYTGETTVPTESMTQFAKVGKALRINGLDSLLSVKDEVQKKSETLKVCPPQDPRTIEIKKQSKVKNTLERNDSHNRSSQDTNILTQKPLSRSIITPMKPIQPQNQENPSQVKQNKGESRETMEINEVKSEIDSSEEMDYEGQEDLDIKSFAECDVDDSSFGREIAPPPIPLDKEQTSCQLQYTVSIRGCLQLILNRFIYNFEYSSNKGTRRWRCAEYRNKKCPALVVTKDNVVIKRINIHNHPFQDKKIVAKIDQRAVFNAIEKAEKYIVKVNENKSESIDESNIDDEDV